MRNHEEKEKAFRAMLEENNHYRSKRMFVIWSLLIIGGIFAILMVSLSSSDTGVYMNYTVPISAEQKVNQKTIDLSWCNESEESRRKAYFYLKSSSEHTDEHMLVSNSYPPELITSNEINEQDLSHCYPLVHFGDFKRLFGVAVNSQISPNPQTVNNTYGDADLIYPCGLRNLAMTSPMINFFVLPTNKTQQEIKLNEADLDVSSIRYGLDPSLFNVMPMSRKLFESKFRLPGPAQSDRFLGTIDCSLVTGLGATTITVVVNGTLLHPIFFSTAFFVKDLEIAVASNPQRMYSNKYFTIISVVLLSFLVILLILSTTKLGTTLF